MVIALIFLMIYPLGKTKATALSKQIEELHKIKANKLEKVTKTEKNINA
jgi:hypothetical protein